MAFVILSYLYHLLISAIEAVTELVLWVFMVSSLTGSYLVLYFNTILRWFVVGIDSFITLSKIVFEDFMVFLYDVGSILALIGDISCGILTNVIDKIIEIIAAVKDAVLCAFTLPYIFYLSVISSVESFIQFVVNTAYLIKRAITLIGSSIWMVLTFVPSLFICLLHTLALSFLEFGTSVYGCFVGMIADIPSRFCDVCFKVFYFFVDIPYEACGGLALAVVLSWLIYKEQRTFKMIFDQVYRLQLKAAMASIQMVRQSCQFVIRQVNIHCRQLYWRRERTSVLRDEMFPTHRNDSVASSSYVSDNSNYMLNLKRKLEAEMEEKLCSVCQERRKTVIVLPCRHLCLCVECVTPVERMSKKCPLCRRHISKTMGVYV
ncbi:uncharacterized protein LOC124159207 [Ischnura elegans]|uniref:uncharacterized protein LOC124159207 n=1 Tax=Ischnura elegans TaxID=197161 RepID=UPI001ED8A05A|nr:uncharacterized protein LOC124159207 [Ischnura elegans]